MEFFHAFQIIVDLKIHKLLDYLFEKIIPSTFLLSKKILELYILKKNIFNFST